MLKNILPLQPLVQEILYSDPLDVFALFAADPYTIFLDSAKTENDLGKYSFIALDPFLTLTSKNGHIELGTKVMKDDPFIVLQNQLRALPLQAHADLPPFQGGVAGYFAYDLCHHLEKVPPHKLDDFQFPDMSLGFYDLVIAFDHQQRRAWIFSSGYPEQEHEIRIKRAEKRCRVLLEKIEFNSKQTATNNSFINNNAKKSSPIKTNFTQQEYEQMVQRVVDYIHAGDIFQANVSQRFSTLLSEELPPFSLYQKLRTINPAPFAAYLNLGEITIASASPERFIKLSNGLVETRPIKGTRPRGKTAKEDKQFENELLNSEKDRAENTMIVDLMRNDLSRVCCDLSVQVTQLCKLESYATVHHLVSSVVGKLKVGLDAVDLIRATFPGGSITGAPKIRAMEIIAEFEHTARGPYCGSIGYIGFDGNMDLSITIRTYAIKDNHLTFQTGGGIVADSNPQDEYQETLIKASALLKALE